MEELILLKKYRLLSQVEKEFEIIKHNYTNTRDKEMFYITRDYNNIVKFIHFKPGYGSLSATYREVFDIINGEYGTDYIDVMKIVKKLLLEHYGNDYVVKFKKYKGKLNHI